MRADAGVGLAAAGLRGSVRRVQVLSRGTGCSADGTLQATGGGGSGGPPDPGSWSARGGAGGAGCAYARCAGRIRGELCDGGVRDRRRLVRPPPPSPVLSGHAASFTPY